MKKEKSQKNKILIIVIAAAIAIAAVAVIIGISKKEKPSVQVIEKETTVVSSDEPVRDFTFTDTTKVYITVNGKDEKEISRYAKGYSGGELFLTPAGMEKVFGLKKEDVYDEDRQRFDKAEKDSGYVSADDADCLKLTREGTTMIFKDGSKMYLCNGVPGMLSGVVIKDGKEFSIPITNLVFQLGYSSIGTSARNDSLYYTLIEKD